MQKNDLPRDHGRSFFISLVFSAHAWASCFSYSSAGSTRPTADRDALENWNSSSARVRSSSRLLQNLVGFPHRAVQDGRAPQVAHARLD